MSASSCPESSTKISDFPVEILFTLKEASFEMYVFPESVYKGFHAFKRKTIKHF